MRLKTAVAAPQPVPQPVPARARITQVHLTLHVPATLPMDLVIRAVNGLAAVLLADVKGRFLKEGTAHFDVIPRTEDRP